MFEGINIGSVPFAGTAAMGGTAIIGVPPTLANAYTESPTPEVGFPTFGQPLPDLFPFIGLTAAAAVTVEAAFSFWRREGSSSN